MSRHFHLAWMVVFFGLSVFLYSAADCGSQATPPAGTPAADDSRALQVPAEKRQKWQSLHNVIQNEYDVCLEHCGYDKTCEDKCMQVYNTRLDRAYKQLMSE